MKRRKQRSSRYEWTREEINDAIAGFVGFGSLFWIIFMMSVIGG